VATNWIIGTAGHIDHGKTSLVKALTGEDTDRLKEEKERGISIVLGFAQLQLPDGTRAGVVDVPGHERFVRTMLAGAHGMDLVLFTVAADDGVMPQTEEHLDILHLLGVTRGIFVVTKTDLVSEARTATVIAAIRDLASGTTLRGSPVLPFSSVTGAGLAELVDRIGTMLREGVKPRPQGRFRLPVDRAFASPGHGQIITGTAVAGEVRRGDTVRCLPGGGTWRVRGIEVHSETVDAGAWGQRLALNLAGSGRDLVERGDVICDTQITLTSERVDARFEIRPGARALKNHQRVRLHLGTAERLGKVVVSGSYGQVTVSPPVLALRGDRFILRDETAVRTIAGGVVLQPAAPRRSPADARVQRTLGILDTGDEVAVAGIFIDESGDFALPLTAIAERLNREPAEVRARLEGAPGLRAMTVDGDLLYARDGSYRQTCESLLSAVKAWHAAHPLMQGLDSEEARASLPTPVPVKMFRLLVQDLVDARSLVREGNLLRLAAHRVQLPPADAALVERIKGRLAESPLAPPDLKQLESGLGLDRRRLMELLRILERQHAIVFVAPDLCFAADVVDRLREDLGQYLDKSGTITAAEFRDRYKTSRKFAIPILEFFDRTGLTVRTGESRRLKQGRATETR
jgi:selenocysteine-specific elongation factor